MKNISSSNLAVVMVLLGSLTPVNIIPHVVFLPYVYKEDCAVQNVWLMGGLSVLTSVPTTPQPVCLLCASKGRHEVIELLIRA